MLNISFFYHLLEVLLLYVYMHFPCFFFQVLHHSLIWNNIFKSNWLLFFLSSALLSANTVTKAGWLNSIRCCLHNTSPRAKWNIFISVFGRTLWLYIYNTQNENRCGYHLNAVILKKWSSILGDIIFSEHRPDMKSFETKL